MKKVLYILMCMVMLCSFLLPVFAEEGGNEQTETTVDASVPRLMVTSYEVLGETVAPGKNATVKVTIKNQSGTKAVKNIKLSIEEGTGDIKPVSMGTQYVSAIYAGSTYVWQFDMTASTTAQIAEHQLMINMEYEDIYFGSYSASDTIRIAVEQSVALDFDGAKLPLKVVQGDTVTVDINLMNTGKTDLRNCKLDFAVNGLDCGGTVFVGEIPAGENAVGSANLRISSEILGDTAGTVTISYEDAYGRPHSKTADLSTTIVEKVITPEETEEEGAKYPLWWAFVLGGLTVGGGIGCAVPIGIYSSKQRKEDEKRL